MKTYIKRLVCIPLCLVAAALTVEAQNTPGGSLFGNPRRPAVLSPEIVQNFVAHIEEMDDIFADMEGDPDYRVFEENMDDCNAAVVAYLEDDGDFAAFQAAFERVRSVRAPAMDRVFSSLGLGQRGTEAFFVITLGTVLYFLEQQLESFQELEGLEYAGELPGEYGLLRERIVRARTVIHPEDILILNENLETSRLFLF
ncbi:MAG: hypothetical protein LBI67_00705 [Treponema sp.]|jgi:hypothetical protein|nr:hypothetical protein [Treponema sp.]